MAYWLVVVGLVLPALGLTVARLVQPSDRYGLAAVAFTPWALPLYAGVLVLVSIRLGVVRRWRDLAVPVALVAVAGLVLHGWWYAPQVAGANPPPAGEASPLVVVTANLRLGEADGVEVVRLASEAHADLLVVEEVTPALLADMDRAGLADLFPHRAGDAGENASGTIAFARVELTDPVRVPTHNSSWAFTMGDLRVLAVHPTYPVDPDGWAADQATIARAVADEDPDLVVGDFNATLDHEPMLALADQGYRDVGELTNAGWHPTWPTQATFGPVDVPLAQIDHVLVGPRLAALGLETADIPGSDHRAVIARVAPK